MSEPVLFGVAIGVVLVVVVWSWQESERRWKRRMRERWEARERAREESRIWFETRLAQIRAQKRDDQPVAQSLPAPHNPGRRRFLPLHEPRA